MKQARAGEARLRTLIKSYSVVSESVRAVHVVCIQAVTIYGRELWCDPREVGKQDDLQLLLNRQAISILGTLHTTPWGAVIRESGLSTARVILDSRQQHFAARIGNASSDKLKERHKNPSSGAPICRAVKKQHEHGRKTVGMNTPAPGEEPVVKTTVLHNTTVAKCAVQHGASETEAKGGAVE
jgi:hypothetical protein